MTDHEGVDMSNATRCAVDGCIRDARKREWCDTHYAYKRRHGEIELLLPTLSLTERLAIGLVEMPNGCLEWTRSTNGKGYGKTWANGKATYTHRIAWELANGPIPPGMQVLHHCDNPPCGQTELSDAYPEGHLFLGTDADNMADMITKGRTRCKFGHLFSEANTRQTSRGRACLACEAHVR